VISDLSAMRVSLTTGVYVCMTQFCQLTRDGEVYHDYCLNYSKAVNYLEQLRKNDEFCDFEKVRDRDVTLLAI